MAGRTEEERGMSKLYSLLPELNIYPRFHLYGDGKAGSDDAHLNATHLGESVAREASAIHLAKVAKSAEELRSAILAKTEELEAKHKQEMELARQSWVEEAGDDLAELIRMTLADMETRLEQSLQQVILPFIQKIIPQAALAEFIQILENALQDDFKGPIFLSGPEDLIAQIKMLLGQRQIEIVSEPSPGIELKARTKSFAITTRMKSWTDGILGNDP